MASVLVTGGAGFIGANFVHHRLRQYPGERLVVLDALTYAGHRESLAAAEGRSELRFVHGDIRDHALVEELLGEEEIDTIVHFAAESHVDRSISRPEAFIEVNIGGTHALLEAARSVWIEGGAPVPAHRFHHVSTDEVFGSLGPDDPPFTESSLYRPNSPYAASKAGADHLVRAYQKTYGLQTTLSNCSNNYGPFQYPEKLIPLMIVNLLGGRDLPIYGDGKNVRDWLHVVDHCAGISAVLESGAPGSTYNIGGECERDNLQLVNALCQCVDRRFGEDASLAERYPAAPPARGESCASKITFVTDRPGHDRRYAIDASKIESELGFRPAFDLDAGLDQTLAWYLDNTSWWERVMDRDYQEWVTAQYGE